MIVYHGTETKFENFDFSKSTEPGVCFTSEVNAARYYGKIIYTVELDISNTLNITDKIGALKIIELCPSLRESIDEIRKNETDCKDIAELIKDEFSYFTDHIEYIGDREELLNAAKNAGYDCVFIDDYTDGDHHETYIALNNSIITKF